MKKHKDSKAKIESPACDEWGDRGNWITLVDFTKIRKGGIPAIEVLRALGQVSKRT